ncbi:MAG: alginate export family protein [Planctomycetota bacterium]
MVSGQDRICAWALDAQLEYLIEAPTHPKVTAEYMFGSGDSDRRLSATSTVGGNRAGTKDRAFNAFGFRDTGIAFGPSISNIHVYSVGASFFPFEKLEPLRKMELGTKVFFYHKAHDSGPISDTTATGGSRWLGWEWDVYCDWRLTSDLAWTIRYGLFKPGAAFPTGVDSPRHLLYTGVVFSF